MKLDDNFKKEWIDFISKHISGTYKVPLLIPGNYSVFNKIMLPYIDVNISVTKKYSRSVEIEYYLFDNKITDIIYLPFNKSINDIANTLQEKIIDKVNNWLLENKPGFIENEYKKIRKK